MPRIMISYRRDDSAGWAALLHLSLASHFGDEDIFIDVDNILVGEDFLKTITKIVKDSEVLVAVIGPDWLHVADSTGHRRLNKDDDTLRVEIRTALQYNKAILPVLVDKAGMPSAEELPKDIRQLAFKHAHDVDPRHHRRDVEALIGHIENALELAEQRKRPTSLEERRQKLAYLEEQASELRGEIAGAERELREEQIEAQLARKEAARAGEPAPRYQVSQKPFNAFLAYSHASDNQLAASLQSALIRFAKPFYRLRSLRVFRDTTNLTATPDLWSSITNAIDSSEYLILFASPQAASSAWINAEVKYWLEMRSPDSILIVLTAGTIEWNDEAGDFDWTRTDALPYALRGMMKAAPLYVDLRWAKDQPSLTMENPEFLHAVGQLAAVLHGRPLDALVGEDVREHRRTIRIVALMAVVLAYAIIITIILLR